MKKFDFLIDCAFVTVAEKCVGYELIADEHSKLGRMMMKREENVDELEEIEYEHHCLVNDQNLTKSKRRKRNRIMDNGTRRSVKIRMSRVRISLSLALMIIMIGMVVSVFLYL